MINSLLNFGTSEIVLVSIFGAILIGLIIYLCFVPMKSFVTALFSGAYIPTFRLIAIKNRKYDVASVVKSYIFAKKSKLDISLNDIEKMITAGGDINNIIKALNFAKSANINLDYNLASTIELSSHDVFSAVQDSIMSKVEAIEGITGITQDNVEIIATAKISVRLNLNNYVDGTGIEDLKGTVGAWIMENISKQTSYKALIKEPNVILLKNLDLKFISKKSMYEILDINISNINIGRDLNLERELKGAEKEKIYAQIEAERIRNAEEIKEIKMKAKTEEMKAAVLQAEAEVPLALSEAIKEGRFSVMDYYKLMNLQADTALRRAFINDNKKSSNDLFDDDDDEGDDF